MKNILSVSLITEKLLFSVKRFPVTVLFAVGWAVQLFYVEMTFFDVAFSRVGVFLAMGALVSLAAALWLEDVVGYLWRQAITVAVVLLCGVYCLYLPKYPDSSAVRATELVAIGVAAFLSIFFVSFLGRGRERAFWNFSVQVAFQLTLALSFGTVIYGGLCLAAYAVESLLGVDNFFYLAHRYLATLCFNLLAAMYWIATIPDKTAKRSEELSVNKFLKVFALYILTPIAALYALIMYVYLFKIVFTWELPRGMVSYMVSTLAVCGLFIITLLLPVRLEGKNRFIIFLTRYFGLMMLPLLALMTAGIFRRVEEYGITINRGYLLLINVWFYGIYIYLVITKAERIKWIPISFAVILLLASFGHWSISGVARRVLVADVSKSLGDLKVPAFDETAFDEFCEKVGGYVEWRKISSKIAYLDRSYGRENILSFFSDSIGVSEVRNKFLWLNEHKDEGNHFYLNYTTRHEVYNINEFNSFVDIQCEGDNWRDKEKIVCGLEGWRLTISIPKDSVTFTIPLRELTARREKGYIRRQSEQPVLQFDDYTVIVQGLDGRHYPATDSIFVERFNGYLFYDSRK